MSHIELESEIPYDNLKDVSNKVDLFRFVCPYCESRNINVIPMNGEPYIIAKPPIDNITDERIKEIYDGAKLVEDIVGSGHDRIIITCEKCKLAHTPDGRVTSTEARKFFRSKEWNKRKAKFIKENFGTKEENINEIKKYWDNSHGSVEMMESE